MSCFDRNCRTKISSDVPQMSASCISLKPWFFAERIASAVIDPGHFGRNLVDQDYLVEEPGVNRCSLERLLDRRSSPQSLLERDDLAIGWNPRSRREGDITDWPIPVEGTSDAFRATVEISAERS